MNRDDRLFAIVGGAVVTFAAAVILVFAGGITAPQEPAPRTVVTPIPAVNEPADTGVVRADLELPGPDGTDELVRRLATGISSHPRWAAWLVTDDLVRRFVTAVDAVADGYSPASELELAVASGPFLVREDEGRLVIAAGTYRRAALLADVVSSIDADDAVTIIRHLAPELETEHREIAWHRGSFDDRLRQAVDHLLAVEVPDGPIEVERRTRTYRFADDRLEHLSDAQRQLVRMGRANATAIQAKLRDIRAAFGWPEPATIPEAAHAVEKIGADARAPGLIAERAPIGTTARPDATPVQVEPMLTPYDPRVTEHGLATSPSGMTTMP
jgi:hypothetical protein